MIHCDRLESKELQNETASAKPLAVPDAGVAKEANATVPKTAIPNRIGRFNSCRPHLTIRYRRSERQ